MHFQLQDQSFFSSYSLICQFYLASLFFFYCDVQEQRAALEARQENNNKSDSLTVHLQQLFNSCVFLKLFASVLEIVHVHGRKIAQLSVSDQTENC